MPEELKLREYQTKIVEFIKDRKKCLVFCGCGMGKTSACLTAIKELGVKRVLVIAPLATGLNAWPSEIEHWGFDFTIKNYCGLPLAKRRKLAALEIDSDSAVIDIINYESAKFITENNWTYDLIIADECTRLKHYRTRSGSLNARLIHRIAARSERFVGLTGTPTPNGLTDLWGQYAFVGDELGRSFFQFAEKFCDKITFPSLPNVCKYVVKSDCVKTIADLARDKIINIKPEQYFSLEKPLFYYTNFNLDEKNLKDYRELKKKEFLEDPNVLPANAAVKMAKLLQLANNFLYVDNDGVQKPFFYKTTKLDALKDLLEDINGESAIICYHFQADLELLKQIEGTEVLSEASIKGWNQGKVQYLLLNPAQAAHGLSLQHGGRNMIFYSMDWNLEQYEQVIERIGPMRQLQSGYKRSVRIYHLVAKNTIEGNIYKALAAKEDVQNNLLKLLDTSGV